MNDAPAGPRLRRQLLLWLMLPLLGLVAATGALGVYTAQRLTDRVFDHWLLDATQSLAFQVSFQGDTAVVDLPPAALAMLSYDATDRVSFEVRQGTRLLAGQGRIPTQGQRPARYAMGLAYDAFYSGAKVRVAQVRLPAPRSGEPVLVQVAETTGKRDSTRIEILLMLVPVAVLLLAAAVAIAYAVRRTLKPLELIARRWNAQSHASLEPIDSHAVPRELVPFAMALNDLLERIRAMLARERLFSAAVAHQLRTPLAGLQLLVARAGEAQDLPGARAAFTAMADATQRAARLVQQLLSLGRIEPEALRHAALSPTDLVALTQEVGMTFVDAAATRGIRLDLVAPGEPLYIALQADLVTEAIGNVLDNALRYTPAGGSILIEITTNPPTLRISDSGPGIAADEGERLFERFYRGRTAIGEGTGLGLAIVREIIAAHGGTVSFGNGALGGACVEIRFASPPSGA